jgi:hypothetical protein
MTQRIICRLPNAARVINGVSFAPQAEVGGALVSETLDAETAARFLRIPGYEAMPEPAPTRSTRARKTADEEAGTS